MAERSKHYELAVRATALALDNMQSDIDAIAELSLAAVAWDAVMGAASPDQLADLDEYVLTDDGGYEIEVGDGGECNCPPDLVARGGFRSGCPVHAPTTERTPT